MAAEIFQRISSSNDRLSLERFGLVFNRCFDRENPEYIIFEREMHNPILAQYLHPNGWRRAISITHRCTVRGKRVARPTRFFESIQVITGKEEGLVPALPRFIRQKQKSGDKSLFPTYD